MVTHKAQHHPCKVEGKAIDFLADICPVLIDANRDPNHIYNIDQTPVQIQMGMNWKVMINRVGAR